MSFEKLTAYLDSLKELHIPACDCSVYVHHQPMYRHFTGFSDAASTVPMNGRETYFIYSATKMFTCVAALQLIEQGKLGLDDPVCKYLPAFTLLTVNAGDLTRAAKNTMTVRHLMSMQSGLDYDLNAKAILNARDMLGEDATTQRLVDAMAHKPLSFEPGTDYQYSLSHDVLAAIIEVVSGQTFGQYLSEHITRPLGIHETGFERTQERLDRMCTQYLWNDAAKTLTPCGQNNPYILSSAYESGGAGLISTVDDYILLVDALACGGVGKTGARILKPETIELYRTPQLQGKSLETFVGRGRLGYSYALGVRVMVDRAFANAKSPNGEFGWDGAAGAYTLVDPEHELSIFHAQHVRGCGFVYFDVHPVIRDMVYEALNL